MVQPAVLMRRAVVIGAGVVGLALGSPGCAPGPLAAPPTPRGAQPTAVQAAPSPRPAATPDPDALTAAEVEQAVRDASAALRPIRFEVVLIPPTAAAPRVTAVNVRGSDPANGFVALDEAGKRTAAREALIALGQLFPNALVQFTVRDASGEQVVIGNRVRNGPLTVNVLR